MKKADIPSFFNKKARDKIKLELVKEILDCMYFSMGFREIRRLFTLAC